MSSIEQPKPSPSTADPTAVPFRLVSSETLKVRRDEAVRLAQAHQTLAHSPTERELEPKRVEELICRIKKGLWLPCSWATVTYDGVKYRMNGQHSSQALLDAGDAIPKEVVVHIDHYETTSPEGMGALFRQFDARISARTPQDVAGAYQGLVKALEGVNRKTAKLGIEGIFWYRRSVEELPVPSGDDLYQHLLLETYHSFLRWLDKILTVRTPELKQRHIVGAMYATFIKTESAAQEFWTRVAKNDLTDDTDPRAVLSAALVKIHEEKTAARKPKPGEVYAKCIKAWGAFRNGEKIRTLHVNTKKGLPEIAA
jgi:hypothetical protein